MTSWPENTLNFEITRKRDCGSSSSSHCSFLQVVIQNASFLYRRSSHTQIRLQTAVRISNSRSLLRLSRPGCSLWVQLFNNPLLPHHQSTAVPTTASTSDFIPDSEAARLRHSLPTFTRKFLHAQEERRWDRGSPISKTRLLLSTREFELNFVTLSRR